MRLLGNAIITMKRFCKGDLFKRKSIFSNKTIVLFFLFCSINTFAQYRKQKPSKEVGLFLGGALYRGDLNSFSPIPKTLKDIQPAIGLIYRYNKNERFSLRLNGIYGKVQADDAKSRSIHQKQRNLHFRSTIIELSGQLELNYLEFKIGSNQTPSSAYLFGGIGGFYFNPQANLGGNWVNLQPLSTEGQGTALSSKKPYSRIQVAVPMGVGVKLNISEFIGLGIEWGWRKLFTDYLDDVSKSYVDPAILTKAKGAQAATLADRTKYEDGASYSNIGRQRGNSKTKDWYSFLGVVLTIKFKEKPDPCPAYGMPRR